MSAVASYSPNNFPDRMEADGIVVEYSDLHEIQQGSPLVGKQSVNSVMLSGFFGGPELVAFEDYIVHYSYFLYFLCIMNFSLRHSL